MDQLMSIICLVTGVMVIGQLLESVPIEWCDRLEEAGRRANQHFERMLERLEG